MDDSALVERRKAELEKLIVTLTKDIERCKYEIEHSRTELEELSEVSNVLARLRGARRSRPKSSYTAFPARFERESKPRGGKKTVGDMIEAVLRAEGRPMMPAQIDPLARAMFDRDFHSKQIGKECCRLRDIGRLIQDEVSKEYALPPELGGEPRANETSPPNPSPAKGRQAVPGGLA